MADINISRKRKSGPHSIIFELSDGEVSPDKSQEHEDRDIEEEEQPLKKCLRTSSELNLESEVNTKESEKNETIQVCQEMVDGKREETSVECGKREDLKETESSATDYGKNESLKIIGGNGEGNLHENLNNLETVNEENKGVNIKFNDNNLKDNNQDHDHLVDSKYHIPTNISQPIKKSPIIKITFNSIEAKETYELKFLEFVGKFLELCPQNVGNSIEIFKDDLLESTEWLVLDEDKEVKELSPKSKKRKHKSKIKKELFTVDTSPSRQEEYLPMYKSKYEVKEEEEVQEDQNKFVSNRSCFNCDGDHNLRDCPTPKDYTKINNARQQFKSYTPKGLRYHIEEEQKFAHLVPGRLSDNLRNALGLSKVELPAHIYKMRVLGYPPGWLKEAKVTPSDLAIFDIEGKNLKGKNKNAGKELIDESKIIDYPGFNVELEAGSYDQYVRYGAPPFCKTSKEAMIIAHNKYQKLEDNLEICDMDMDNSDKEPTPPGESNNVQVDILRKSPSLVDLESQKEQLLAQLVTDSNTLDSEIRVLDESSAEMHTKNKDIVGLDDSITENDDLIVLDESNCENDENNFNNSIKNSIFGTPIIKSSSSYSRLPNPDNFSKDVSPVINFENLPNATGKYEQMSGILEKVRKTLKNKES